jgi:plasmid stability protein
MAVNLSIKNVPDTLAETLRARAERNHRSLQGELMAILERAVDAPAPAAEIVARPAPKLSIDEAAERARKLFPEGTPSSTDFIRAMRDGRYGDEWVRTGNHPPTE